MGLFNLFDPAGMIRSYIRSQGWRALRFSFDDSTGTLWLSVLIHDKTHSVPLPLNRTITADEISDVLTKAIAAGDLGGLIDQAAAIHPPADPPDTSG